MHDQVLTEEEIRNQFQNVRIPQLTLINKVPGNFDFERMEFMGDAIAKFIQTDIILANFIKSSVKILFVNHVFFNVTDRIRNCEK